MTFDVVVPYRATGCPHRARAWSWVDRRWTAQGHDVVLGASPDGPFNIAAALNNGVARSDADIVLLTGADVVIPTEAIEAAAEAANSGRWVMVADEYRRLTRDASDELTAGPVTATVHDLPGERMRTRLGWGPIVAPRDVLVGYDEHFRGWGGEDDAFGIAMHALVGPPVRLGATVHMLWHPRDNRHDHPDYRANLDRLRLYQQAKRDPDRLRALLADQPSRPPCDFAAMGMRCRLATRHVEPHLLAV